MTHKTPKNVDFQNGSHQKFEILNLVMASFFRVLLSFFCIS